MKYKQSKQLRDYSKVRGEVISVS